MKYYTLATLENGSYHIQFGDYDKDVVKQEIEDSYSDRKCKIVVSADDQESINAAIEKLNKTIKKA